MIWKPPPAVHPARSILSTYLQSEIVSVCGDEAVPYERAAEIAGGVAAYCVELAQEDAALPSDYLAALVARALSGAGEENAARQFAARRLSGDPDQDVLDGVRRLRGLSPVLWNVFRSGLIRPSRWLVGGGGVTWVLDLSRLRPAESDSLDLAFSQGVRALLHAVAPIWDEEGGEGVLGLRWWPNPRPRARQHAVRSRREATLDLRRFCQDVLQRLKSRRGWAAVPRVIGVDACAV
jgi:hypothetical protein